MTKTQEEQAKSTKSKKIQALLLRSNRVAIVEIARSAYLQPKSVRGFMSGTLIKRFGLGIASKAEDGKPRRYFIGQGAV